PLPDLLEHGRIAPLHPFVHRRRAGGENKIVVFLHPVQRGSERRLRLLKAFLPLPQPDRVQMRVPDHVQPLVLHDAVPSLPLTEISDSLSSYCQTSASCAAYNTKPTHQEWESVSIIPLGWKQLVL